MTLLNSAFNWHPISIYYIVSGKRKCATSPPSPRFIAMGLEPNPALDSTLGAAFVSVIISAVLFGMLTTQCYYYFFRSKHDPRWLKCIVIGLWTIDFAHQFSASIMIFQYSLCHFGDFQYLKKTTWPPALCVMLEPFPAFVVQMSVPVFEGVKMSDSESTYRSYLRRYFTRRSYCLNPKLWPMTIFIVTLSVLTLGVGEGKPHTPHLHNPLRYRCILACGINTLLIDRFAQLKDYTWLVALWLVTCSVCDISVTLSVVWTLYTSRTGFKDTDALLTKLIIWTVSTGALRASFALFQLIMFIIKNDTLIHLAANIVLAKLYSNTFVASLNRRGHPLRARQIVPTVQMT
ncbi:hypothetical protein BS47DRAFT_1382910 [Hydnum rufescens UP504]|uniref:DUF6534 domain-containing protein n=1 Tax=Hydnum rufescens UP504 TaxID=1448309 RepID=A0A9P6DVB9_9AGAM|nr:hypothetical protein BS47DRAFT_1382910 [Hydnum rufescens UP504]